MFMAVSPATPQKERMPVAKMADKTLVEIFSSDMSIYSSLINLKITIVL